MHKPVLLKEVIEVLNPKPGEFFIDGTIGKAGHSLEILKRIGLKGKLLGIDWDSEVIKKLEIGELKNYRNVILINDNYANLPEILKKHKLPKANGLILDLGFLSEQLESGRGFSFLKDEPLDMRYNSQKDLTAVEIVNSFSEKDLANIFYNYGEERYSRRIAKRIIEERRKKPIKTTFELTNIIKKATPKNYKRSRIHFATRVFQALRIYVNDELGNLEKLLKNLTAVLKPKGRIAIISFHSLEDRLVKNYFRKMAKERKARILTKKPVRPTIGEIQINPHSRSAKSRAIILI